MRRAVDFQSSLMRYLPCRLLSAPNVALLAFVSAAMLVSPAAAATRTVLNLNDNGPGSLRQTLAAAQDGDTVNFAVTGTIVLIGFELDIGKKNLTIEGPGAKLLAVSGNNEGRVMNILFNASVTVSGLTIRDGFVTSRGGGIFSSGTLTLRDCMVLNSRSDGDGGGIANGESGTMQIERCTIADNLVTSGPVRTAVGGGIYNDGVLTIFNSTVANNEARIDGVSFPNANNGGGGIYSISSPSRLEISGCTISGNRVTGAGVGRKRGGGFLIFGATVRDTIVAGNEAAEGPDVDGEDFVSGGYNLIGKLANDGDAGPGGFQHGVNRDQVGGAGRPPIDPRLGALGDNGGSTFTMALLSGSPAIDQGLSSFTTDQRGAARRFDFAGTANVEGGDGSDVGAFELAAAKPAALLNISTRAEVQQGNKVMIGGFIIIGSEPKNVLLRGIGPSLTGTGVQGALQNPTMDLFQGGTLLATNDDWKQTQRAEIEATGIPPKNDAEPAIVRRLSPGSYTAVLQGVNNETGIALVEAYDLDQATVASQLGNISTRAFVQTGEKVLIGGIIAGPVGVGNSHVLIRAIGPTLVNAGVQMPLQNPTLELFDANGTSVASNDNWRSDQETEIRATTLAPSDDRESAILRDLAPAAYTAIVRGAGATTGVGLVEVYNLSSTAP
jgi:hypothetical protein